MALRSGATLDVHSIVCDEFHYYADRDRGTAWQIPLLTLPQATFLLMSATLGDATFFQQKLEALTGKPTSVVQSNLRPVPLAVCLAGLSAPIASANSIIAYVEAPAVEATSVSGVTTGNRLGA